MGRVTPFSFLAYQLNMFEVVMFFAVSEDAANVLDGDMYAWIF